MPEISKEPSYRDYRSSHFIMLLSGSEIKLIIFSSFWNQMATASLRSYEYESKRFQSLKIQVIEKFESSSRTKVE